MKTETVTYYIYAVPDKNEERGFFFHLTQTDCLDNGKNQFIYVDQVTINIAYDEERVVTRCLATLDEAEATLREELNSKLRDIADARSRLRQLTYVPNDRPPIDSED